MESEEAARATEFGDAGGETQRDTETATTLRRLSRATRPAITAGS